MFVLLLTSWLQLTVGLQRQTTLDAQSATQSGASITRNPQSASISESMYNIVVTKQESDYDLKLSLDRSWAFQPDTVSTLTLSVDGHTPFPKHDTDLLLVFSVSDWQYFSFFVHLDTTYNIKSRIYSSLATQHITRSVSDWISDYAIHSRWDRISNDNQWQIIPNWNKQALWPLQFVITNDPLHDQTVFAFYHNTTASYATGHVFDHAFATNQSFDMYIMGDSIAEKYTVSSIRITSTNPTANPTQTPSIAPSPTPTVSPTRIPTQSPSYTPTVPPSVVPSVSPSISPSVSPSHIPTSETVSYRMVITVTFECELSVNSCPFDQQVLVLQDITQRIVNQTCTNANVTSNKHDQIVITSTVFICGEAVSPEMRRHFDSDSALQKELIQNIHKETDIEIIANQTMIEMVPSDPEDETSWNVDFSTTSIIALDIMQKTKKEATMPTEYTILAWTIKLIAIQLILCCVLSLFFFSLKCRTKKLKDEQDKIDKLSTNIKDKPWNSNTDDDAFLPMKTSDDVYVSQNDNSLTREHDLHDVSTLYLAETHAKGSHMTPNVIPLCSTTIDSMTYTNTTSPSEDRASMETVAPLMLRILRNEAMEHVPQQTDTSVLTTVSSETSTFPSSLPLIPTREPLPNVVIVSEAGTWDTEVPSIPRSALPLFRCDLGSSTQSMITKTKTMTGVPTHHSFVSPTLTFSGPKYTKDGRRSLV